MHGMRVLRAIGLAAAGALTATGLLGIATIRLPLLAVAGALYDFVGRDRGLTPADAVFAFAGAAAAFAALGVASLPYVPCENSTITSDPPMPGQPSSCGGFNPAIYFVPAALALAGAIGATIEQRRRCSGR